MANQQQSNMQFSNDSYDQSSSSRNNQYHEQPQSGFPFPFTATTSPDFDILDWHPAYQSCQRYFLDHAQHEPGTQALCALINIRLPYQWRYNPVHSSTPPSAAQNQSGSSSTFTFNAWPRPTTSPTGRNGNNPPPPPIFVSLVPFVRRLVVTGFDKAAILHGFFGDAYMAGVSPLQECERRNYLFAAKHGGWRSCKKQYDLGEEETVPFMKPLQNVRPEELDAADKAWSSWLAMEDWMLGPRAPGDEETDGVSIPRGNGTNLGMDSNTYDRDSDRMGRE